MPEAGQPPQMLYAATPRRRRSGFRRHRTYCRLAKGCCQSKVVRLRRTDHPDTQRPYQCSSLARDGYWLTEPTQRRSLSEHPRRGSVRRHVLRRGSPRRHSRRIAELSLLLPQSVASAWLAPIRRPVLPENPATERQPSAAAPRIRNARRARRDQRRFRPSWTTFSAARPARR